jgi:hypothetical protein
VGMASVGSMASIMTASIRSSLTKHRPGRGAGRLSSRSRIPRRALAPTKPPRPLPFARACGMARSIRSTDSTMPILPVTGCHPRFGKCAVAGTNWKRTFPIRSLYTPTEPRRHCARRLPAFRTRSPPGKSGSVERICIFDETRRRYNPRVLSKPKTTFIARSDGYSCQLCYSSWTRKSISAGSCWAARRKAPRSCSVSMVRCLPLAPTFSHAVSRR